MKKLLIALMGTTLLVGCSLHEHYTDTEQFFAPEVLDKGVYLEAKPHNGGIIASEYDFKDDSTDDSNSKPFFTSAECYSRNDIASYKYDKDNARTNATPLKEFNIGNEYSYDGVYILIYLISNCEVVMEVKQSDVSLLNAEVKYLNEHFGFGG